MVCTGQTCNCIISYAVVLHPGGDDDWSHLWRIPYDAREPEAQSQNASGSLCFFQCLLYGYRIGYLCSEPGGNRGVPAVEAADLQCDFPGNLGAVVPAGIVYCGGNLPLRAESAGGAERLDSDRGAGNLHALYGTGCPRTVLGKRRIRHGGAGGSDSDRDKGDTCRIDAVVWLVSFPLDAFSG